MAYADLKNDYVFRRVFGQHPRVLMGLLNDLLERRGAHAITAIEYLPSDQVPRIPGFKLSILDLKCQDATGETFVVEMQVVPVKGFLNRVVYNTAKAYIRPLQKGGDYADLGRVIGVSICNFALWTDKDQDARGQPHVPMVSRWRFTERRSGAEGIDDLRFVFFELAKMPDRAPRTRLERWAVLFRNAPVLNLKTARALDLSRAQREALRLARLSTFTPDELDAYERARDEVGQVQVIERAALERGLAEGEKLGLEKGEKLGIEKGEKLGRVKGLREALTQVLAARGFTLTESARARIAACEDEAALARWMTRAATAPALSDVFD